MHVTTKWHEEQIPIFKFYWYRHDLFDLQFSLQYNVGSVEAQSCAGCEPMQMLSWSSLAAITLRWEIS